MKKDVLYPPSWVDRLLDWIDRLPVPTWAFFLILFLFQPWGRTPSVG